VLVCLWCGWRAVQSGRGLNPGRRGRVPPDLAAGPLGAGTDVLVVCCFGGRFERRTRTRRRECRVSSTRSPGGGGGLPRATRRRLASRTSRPSSLQPPPPAGTAVEGPADGLAPDCGRAAMGIPLPNGAAHARGHTWPAGRTDAADVHAGVRVGRCVLPVGPRVACMTCSRSGPGRCQKRHRNTAYSPTVHMDRYYNGLNLSSRGTIMRLRHQ
jgi:hypothetical protein